jgi:hypothetical protein
MKRSSLVTAALPRGNCTRFPILPFGHSFTFQTTQSKNCPRRRRWDFARQGETGMFALESRARKLFLPADSITRIPGLVLCEFDQWTGARNSREIREQLRCCDWIRLPMSQSPKFSKVKAGRRCAPKGSEPQARSQNICPLHLIRVAACADGPEKLLREKEE